MLVNQAAVRFYCMLSIMRGCGSCHHSMARPQVAYGGDVLQMLKVAANVVIKQWRAADKG
jgi:hypothetical protein